MWCKTSAVSQIGAVLSLQGELDPWRWFLHQQGCWNHHMSTSSLLTVGLVLSEHLHNELNQLAIDTHVKEWLFFFTAPCLNTGGGVTGWEYKSWLKQTIDLAPSSSLWNSGSQLYHIWCPSTQVCVCVCVCVCGVTHFTKNVLFQPFLSTEFSNVSIHIVQPISRILAKLKLYTH